MFKNYSKSKHQIKLGLENIFKQCELLCNFIEKKEIIALLKKVSADEPRIYIMNAASNQ